MSKQLELLAPNVSALSNNCYLSSLTRPLKMLFDIRQHPHPDLHHHQCKTETRLSKQCKSLIWIMILGFLCFNLLQNLSRRKIVARDTVAKDLVARDIDIWWYWVNIGRYWLVFGGTGSVWGSTGWYLVILGQYNLVLFGIKWYWVNKGLLCLYILKKINGDVDRPTDQPTNSVNIEQSAFFES